ncbi:hypothetical protein ES705_30676 [subsurface metagenome]
MSELADDVVHSPVYRSLIESIKEEAEAMEAYDKRKTIAEEHGQKKIADLYDHVRGEEEHHFKEFRRAATNMYLGSEEKRDPDFERKFSAFLKREGFLDNPGNPRSKGSSSKVALTTEQKWNQAFEYILPAVSLGIATLSVILGVMTLTRSSPLGRRFYYQDGQYFVSVRYPGQWNDIREFVQPDNPDVLAIYSQIGPDVWGCLDFVCRNVNYRRDTGEHWQFSSETLRGTGDCEDTSILLASLLNNFTNAYVALGEYGGYGHAWCQLDGQVFESTYTQARPVPDPGNYEPLVLFNNVEVNELYPGALTDIFTLRRDEAAKLNLMAEVLADHG